MQSGLMREWISRFYCEWHSNTSRPDCIWHNTHITARLFHHPPHLRNLLQVEIRARRTWDVVIWLWWAGPRSLNFWSLTSPGNNYWQLPVTTENQQFPCETLHLITNSQQCLTPPCLEMKNAHYHFLKWLCRNMEWQHHNPNLKPLQSTCSLLSDCYFCHLYSTFCTGTP